jgi:hypothetical protein
MTITIPTAELIGLLTDVASFAPADKDDIYWGVQLEWGGRDVYPNGTDELGVRIDELTASAYSTTSGARATWEPGTGREGEIDESGKAPAIDTEDVRWGGDDSPWRAFLSMSDVRDLIKLFKVPAKLWAYPLTLDVSATGDRLTVRRTAEFGKPAASMTVDTHTDRFGYEGVKFPDVAAVVKEAREHTAPSDGEMFWAHQLGALGAVRGHDSLHITLPAEGYPSTLLMGERWQGFVYGPREQRAAGARRAALGV